MERIERLERRLGELLNTVEEISEGLLKIDEELKELKETAKKQVKKPQSLKLHKTAFKVKNSKYNGSKIVIVEKGEDSIAFAMTKEDWLKLRDFLDSYFKADNGSKQAKRSYNKKSYNGKSHSKKQEAKAVEVEEVEGYENALAED